MKSRKRSSVLSFFIAFGCTSESDSDGGPMVDSGGRADSGTRDAAASDAGFDSGPTGSDAALDSGATGSGACTNTADEATFSSIDVDGAVGTCAEGRLAAVAA